MRRPGFQLVFAPQTIRHLDVIEGKDHRLIQETIHQRLSYAPDEVTRNCKPLKQPAPFGATWELRFGPQNRFRVFYEVDHENAFISVLAIGMKERNRLLIGGEEF